MRLSTFVFLVLGFGSLGGTGWILWHVTADSREWHKLRSYSGRDLDAAGPEIQNLFQKLLPEWEGSIPPATIPVRWLVGLDGPDSREAVLFCQHQANQARLTLIDRQRRTVFAVNVRVRRWHESIVGLRGNTRPDVAPWTFAVEMDGIGSEGVGFAHYAVLEDRPALLRLERLSGESVPNVYRDGDQVGPEPPLRASEAWERQLSSGSLAEILEVLHWLGGLHATPVMGRAGYPTESPEQIQMFQETARRPAVLSRIRELARHAHPWIAHAAEQARLQVEK